MTPAEAARALADDYDLIGTQDADWMATAWRRYAEKLDSTLHTPSAANCRQGHGMLDKAAVCEVCP